MIILMKKLSKNAMFAIYCWIVVIICFSNIYIEASQEKRFLALSKSQYSEKVQQEDELYLWTTMTYNQLMYDLESAIAEVNEVVENHPPIVSQGKWIFEEKTENYQTTVICHKESSIPLAASKRCYYQNYLSEDIQEIVQYRLYYSSGTVLSFNKFDEETLSFYDGIIERYGFKLNENRTSEIQFDEKGKLKRVIISKPKNPQEEKVPQYKMYFPDNSDLSILKNKLLDRTIKISRIAYTKEAEKNQSLVNKSLGTDKYDIQFDSEGKVERYYDKNTKREVSLYSSGRVKSFSLILPNGKQFRAQWDMQMGLSNEEIR